MVCWSKKAVRSSTPGLTQFLLENDLFSPKKIWFFSFFLNFKHPLTHIWSQSYFHQDHDTTYKRKKTTIFSDFFFSFLFSISFFVFICIYLRSCFKKFFKQMQKNIVNCVIKWSFVCLTIWFSNTFQFVFLFDCVWVGWTL